MKAICEITIEDNKKKIVEKESNNRKILIDWIMKISSNGRETIGYLEDGTFAIFRGEQ